jgi:putative transcriptional regulator
MPPLKQPEFGELIQQIRQRIGLTQEEFALKIGVSYTSVNRWENHKTMPVALVLRRIEEILREMGDRGQDLLENYFSN